MRRSSNHSGNSLKIALIFTCCIVLLIAGGFLLKLFLILRASTFDGVHQYIVEIDESHQKGMIVAFNPSSKSVVTLHVNGKVDSTFGKYLELPVDGVINMTIPSSSTKLVSDMLFQSREEKGITIIDKLKLLLFVNSLKKEDFHDSSLSLPVDASVTEKLLPSLFLDNTLYFDNESITVINASGEEGLASAVAHQLSTIGMNVISVITAQEDTATTTLAATNTNTYTVHRIERLFHVDALQEKTGGISDITLTIGKKSISELQ